MLVTLDKKGVAFYWTPEGNLNLTDLFIITTNYRLCVATQSATNRVYNIFQTQTTRFGK